MFHCDSRSRWDRPSHLGVDEWGYRAPVRHAMDLPKSLTLPCALALLLAPVACTDDGASDEHSDHDDHHHETETGDGDGDPGDGDGDGTPGDGDGDGAPDDLQIELQFGAAVGDQDVACGQQYDNIGSLDTTVEIQDFRFYVSAIELLDGQGNAAPLVLEQDGLWQYEDVALLDFEDGTGLCLDAGTAELNDTVIGTVPAGDYVGVRFILGVPFELNHQDVGMAPSPLNVPSMFWTWQGGYKFARVDLRNDNPDGDSWFWHQGSTGCMSVGPEQPPTEPCTRSNRLPVEFDAFDWQTQTIVLDIGMMLDGVDVSQNTPMTAPGCMSAPDDPQCMELFPKLGLSLDTGACASDCADQQVFRVE